jgi:hypothetical protein
MTMTELEALRCVLNTAEQQAEEAHDNNEDEAAMLSEACGIVQSLIHVASRMAMRNRVFPASSPSIAFPALASRRMATASSSFLATTGSMAAALDRHRHHPGTGRSPDAWTYRLR